MNLTSPDSISQLAQALSQKHWGKEAADTLGAPADLIAALMRRAGIMHPLQEPALGSTDLRRVFGSTPVQEPVGGLYGMGQRFLGW